MPESLSDLERIIECLSAGGVQYVLIGGMAAIAHGADYSTNDVDVVYQRTSENIEALVRAVKPLHPMLRTRDGAVPFLWDARTVKEGLNFTLETDAGWLDVLGEASGAGGFDQLAPRAITLDVLGMHVRVAALPDLIEMKRAAGRGKDLALNFQLQALVRLKSGTEGNGGAAPEEN